MVDVYKKLKYNGQARIAFLNAPSDFAEKTAKQLQDVKVDSEIDAKFLYDFMIAFVQGTDDVNRLGPSCIHNLSTDGKLWMAYPKGTSRKYSAEINRDHGWDALTGAGFRTVSQVAIDDDWSALRFRNIKFVRSAKEKR